MSGTPETMKYASMMQNRQTTFTPDEYGMSNMQQINEATLAWLI